LSPENKKCIFPKKTTMSVHFISLDDAVSMTTLHRSDKETVLDTSYKNNNVLPTCETFDRDAFDAVLGQSGCVKLRIYYGMNSSNQVHAIIVGVNEDDEDMIPASNTETSEASSQIIEAGVRCPVDCPPPSDLNS
jgi:hypothetical protein